MTKINSVYICQQCGFQSSQFLGKCPQCGTWNSLVETVEESSVFSRQPRSNRGQSSDKKRIEEVKIVNLAQVEKQQYERVSTGFNEFDRVLGGGIVPGSVVLVSGDPGIGKSTLLLQLALGQSSASVGSPAHSLANASVLRPAKGRDSDTLASGSSRARRVREQPPSALASVLYVAGEESAQQIKIRAERIIPQASLDVLNEVDVDIVCDVLQRVKPSLAIIDSIQTMETEDLTGIAGSVGQVRETAHRLQRLAKALQIPMFIVGHVTKEGSIAGPKTLEHLVDVVLSLEGEQNTNFRVLRASKNRFGSTDEVGIFEMEEGGLVEVNNPSKLFLEQKVEAPGSAVVVTMAGQRPLLVEIQALVSKSFLPQPRRVASGVDGNKLQLLVAVLSKRLGLPLFDQDVFVNVTGGLRMSEPAVDLGVAMAVISSLKNQSLSAKTAFVGEVGLLGELRPVRQLSKRITEAKKLGFSKVISSENAHSLAEAVKLVLRV